VTNHPFDIHPISIHMDGTTRNCGAVQFQRKDDMHTICIYCGKASVHPERVFRYCSDERCVRRGTAFDTPQYQSKAVSDESIVLKRQIDDLTKALEDANITVMQLTERVELLQALVDEGFEDAYKVHENTISVARFDCYQAMIDSHREYVWAGDLANHPDEYVRDIYKQMRSTLERGMGAVGIRTYGTVGAVVNLSPDNDEYNRIRYECKGSGGAIISMGYETTTGMVIRKAIVQSNI
jgi:hypothetical protein